MGEQRVPLKHVAEPPLLGRQVDAGSGIEENRAVHVDPPFVGPHEAGETLERQRLPSARRTEERDDFGAGVPAGVEREPWQPLDDANLERPTVLTERAHDARAPSRPATTRTAHESTVSKPTRTRTWLVSPVCTAV